METDAGKWKFHAVKIEDWWQVVAQDKASGWFVPVAYFVSEKMAASYADVANCIEGDADWSEMDNVPAEAKRPPVESAKNIIPLRFTNHLTDWNEEQDKRLTMAWDAMVPKEEIAKSLGRTRQGIERRARYLGLRSRSKMFDKDERELGKSA